MCVGFYMQFSQNSFFSLVHRIDGVSSVKEAVRLFSYKGEVVLFMVLIPTYFGTF